MYKILIIEDDNIIATEVKKYFEAFGHDVNYIKDFENVMQEFTSL